MKHVLWLFKWILKTAIFFTLLAFALNNQHEASVHFFFGTQWRAPQVLIVLAALALGVTLGVLVMVPRWWKHKHRPHNQLADAGTTTPSPTKPSSAPHGF
jgi:lipopolysaccharide assembly protein A